VKKLILVVAFLAGTAACSSNTCQNSIIPLNYGDCATDAGVYNGPTDVERSACDVGCASSSDQTGIANLFSCLSGIPAAVGVCSSATEGTWVSSVANKAEACGNTAQTQLSSACKTAIALGSIPDAG
jgi:hypothetical protein